MYIKAGNMYMSEKCGNHLVDFHDFHGPVQTELKQASREMMKCYKDEKQTVGL